MPKYKVTGTMTVNLEKGTLDFFVDKITMSNSKQDAVSDILSLKSKFYGKPVYWLDEPEVKEIK